MKKLVMYFVFAAAIASFVSCARSITPYEAANGRARCGRSLR